MNSLRKSKLETNTYNGYNQLISRTENGKTNTYTYDINGLRNSKTVNGVTTKQVWSMGELAMEINGADSTVKAKYYHGLTPIGMRTSGGQLYYTTSYNGTVEKVTNLGGGVVADYAYDAFGNQESTSGTIYNPFRYCGEYFDEESGLIYLRNRYYDPSIGAFINEDPARDGLNWYSYCSGNPVAFVDPLGLDAIVITTGTFDVYGNAHTSVIAQDSQKNWYYFYWGNKNAVLLEVPSDKLTDLDTFNKWLVENGAGDNGKETDRALHDSSDGYTTATYIEGNFSETINYYLDMAQNANMSEVIEDGKHKYTNNSYKLTDVGGSVANCMTVSFDGLKKGKLLDGTSFSDFVHWDDPGSIRPNDFRVMIRETFANQSFTKSAARVSAIWNIGIEKPWYMSQNYYNRGQKYGEILKNHK